MIELKRKSKGLRFFVGKFVKLWNGEFVKYSNRQDAKKTAMLAKKSILKLCELCEKPLHSLRLSLICKVVEW